jgi:hypothetical protein
MIESDPRELLSALLDREPVDPDALSALLEDREARALLVDFVRVRFALADREDATAARPRTVPRERTVGRTMLQIAAALLLVTLGAMAGRRLAADPDAPPEPTRVIQLATVPNGGTR